MSPPVDVERPAVLVGEEPLTFVDLVLVGLLAGDWQAMLSRSAAGVGARAAGRAPDPPLALERERAVRLELKLFSADELRAWLAERSLDHAAWKDHFVRSTLVAPEVPGPGALSGGVDGLDPAMAADVWWADACVSGFWRGCTRTVSGWWAAAQLLAEPEPTLAPPPGGLADHPSLRLLGVELPTSGERLARLAAWQAASVRLPAHLCGPEMVEGVLAQEPLRWTRFDLDEMRLANEATAREVRLCLTEDGLPLSEVVDRSGTAVQRVDALHGDLVHSVGAAVAAAQPGDVVGPVAVDDEWMVAVLRHRRRSTIGDPEVRERICGALVGKALDRAVTGRVRELGPL